MTLNRIVIKLGGTILLLFLMVLLPLGFVIDRAFSEFYYRQVQTEIEELSSHYAESFAVNYNSQMAYMVEMMAEFSKTKLYIINAEGTIIANSAGTVVLKGFQIPENELKDLKLGKSVNKRFEALDNQSYLVSGKPIVTDGGFIGGVYVLSSIDAIDDSIEEIRRMLLLSGLGSFLLALGFTYVLSRKLSNPLIQMEKATRKISKGDLQTRVHVISNDEIGSLGKAINDLAYDLQKYRESRSEFFSNVSHELRTPMTSLEGYAKVLKEKLYQTEEEKDQYIDIIHKESVRVTRMIGDLFELSKMEEGKIDFDFEWIDISEVLDSAVNEVLWKAKEKGLKINYNVQPDLPLIYCDGHRMIQVFLNLLENAIRYTQQGSISVSMSAKKNVVQCIVEDTGIGIPIQELPYIFERFYRVEKSRSREFGGTGLGLAIVKNLVELQGGIINVHSEVEKGTRFELTFPVLSNQVNQEVKED
ncbi:hypothetical protein B9K06_12640 [Bacillus sp. OG2]|nr:hypothetical protein B9K06_12640 [Bacillus sp. OG2]